MPSRISRLTPFQVATLPRLLDADVTDEDANGHLNVTGYLALYDRAAWPWLASLGLDPSLSDRARGIMDLEHHLRYLAEIHVGDQVAVHGQLLNRTERRVHGVWYLLNLAGSNWPTPSSSSPSTWILTFAAPRRSIRIPPHS